MAREYSQYATVFTLLAAGTLLSACEGISYKITPATTSSTSTSLAPLSPAADATQILAGQKAYKDDGTVLTGTATNQGTLDLNTTAIPGSSGGFYTSIVLALSASNVCAGTSIFGSAGTALCSATFGDLMASTVVHDVLTTQLSLTGEKAAGDLPAGYREVIDLNTDDDGRCDSNSCGFSNILKATAPSTPCGTSQNTVAARIADCSTQNGTGAIWIGSARGMNGEATWKLVSYTGAYEVWRDERTGLLWSDYIANDNWCKASGNHQWDDPSNFCNDTSGSCSDGSSPDESSCIAAAALWTPTRQAQVQPQSHCAESSGLYPVPANGEDWVAGTYHGAKGGMGKVATSTSPSVRWRLPTLSDWLQADIDGIKFVLPNLARDATFYNFWVAMVNSRNRNYAFIFGSTGYLNTSSRINNQKTRCVGR